MAQSISTDQPEAPVRLWSDPMGTTVGECLSAIADCYAEIAAIYRRAVIAAPISRQPSFARRAKYAAMMAREVRPEPATLQ